MTPNESLAQAFQMKSALAAAHGIIRALDKKFLEGKGEHADNVLTCECEVGLYYKLLDQSIQILELQLNAPPT